MQEVYHPGEIAVQTRGNTRRQARQLAGMVDDCISSDSGFEHFQQSVPQIFVSFFDPKTANVWVSAIFGAPRCLISLQTYNQVELYLPDSKKRYGDVGVLLASLQHAADTNADGALAMSVMLIEFSQRARFRINGRGKLAANGQSIVLRVVEAFGNCPKYIQARSWHPRDHTHQAPAATRTGTELTAEQMALVRAADTFLMGSHYSGTGTDLTHRGGLPGFIRLMSPQTLLWPEYAGNGMHQTQGNLHLEPHCGLLFVDWATHSVLALSGRAELVWVADEVQLGGAVASNAVHAGVMDGRDRYIRFTVEVVRAAAGVVAHDYRLLQSSPYNPPLSQSPALTAVLNAAATRLAASSAKVLDSDSATPQPLEESRQAAVPLMCVAARREAHGVATFRLQAVNGEALPAVVPGQHGLFTATVAGEQLQRSWTISGWYDGTNAGVGDADQLTGAFCSSSPWLEISVKLAEQGRVSPWLHRELVPGARLLSLAAVEGRFVDQPQQAAVFFAAGVGITPAVAMARNRIARGRQRLAIVQVDRDLTRDFPFARQLQAWAVSHPDLVAYTAVPSQPHRPTPAELVALLAAELKQPDVVGGVGDHGSASGLVVYVCGPASFEKSVVAAASQLGIPDSQIRREHFYY